MARPPCRPAGRSTPPRSAPAGRRCRAGRSAARRLAGSSTASARAGAQHARAGSGRSATSAAPGPNSSMSASVSGSSAAAAHRCGASTYGFPGSSTVASTGRCQDRLGVVHQVGVQRVVAGDQDGDRPAAVAAGPASLLPQGRPGARPAGDQHGVEPGDVDAEFQRGRGGQAGDRARPAARPPAPAGPRRGTRTGRPRPRRPGPRRRPRPAPAGRPCATASAPRRDRTKASAGTSLDHQVGQQRRRPPRWPSAGPARRPRRAARSAAAPRGRTSADRAGRRFPSPPRRPAR